MTLGVSFFCSKTEPVSNRMGRLGSLAYGAVLIGSCQTKVPENVGDEFTFVNEIGNSLISRTADLSEILGNLVILI